MGRLGWKGLGACFGSVLVAGLLLGSHCGIESRSESPSIVDDQEELEAAPREEEFGRCAEFTKTRRPFFGELHLHTTYSLDANLEGTRLTPREAYAFAQGEPVTPPGTRRAIRIDRPLDFAAVTDHAEFLGFIAACQDPKSKAYKQKGCKIYRNRPDFGVLVIDAHLTHEEKFHNAPRACGDGGEHCRAYRESMWIDLQNEAERHYDRSGKCRFTTFVGYEWSASPADGTLHVGKVHNLHRNVIFRNSIVPRVPVDFFDAGHVEELWSGLRKHCIDVGNGCDVLTIPHNANLSAGRMFAERIVTHKNQDRGPFTVTYAQDRAMFEPLMEIYQHKGSSECLPGQTAGDELCDFEVVPYDNLRAAKQDKKSELSEVDTMQYGLGQGLRLEQELGVNPFQYGIIAGTDNHLGLTGNVNEALFKGGGGAGEMLLGDDIQFPDRVYFGGGGLAGIWAEENSREALFRALRRKETFGTSGPRMAVRMFGGWNLPRRWCDRDDRIDVGYERGVPMGGELTAPPAPHAVPIFAIESVADGGTEALPGAKLQRIQIVKGFLDDEGKPQTRVFEVAGGKKLGRDLDLRTCQPSHEGFQKLCAVWRDETFKPRQRAYYYVRVMEVPTCRWSTRMCVEAEYDCDNKKRKIDEQCCAESAGLHPRHCGKVICDEAHDPDPCCQIGIVRPVIQERAWTSPIWYSP